MLLEFSVSNFRSIKDMQTLSFLATAMNEHEKTNTFQATDKIRLLKSTAVYGANGSGKSNLVKAMMAMLNFIKYSFKDETIGSEIIKPFKLDDNSPNEATFFQIIFLIDNKKYRYGFTFIENQIDSEWLFGTMKKNEVELFTREALEIKVNEVSFKDFAKIDVNKLEKDIVKNNLLINLYAILFGGTISKSIKEYLQKQYIISAGINDSGFIKTSLKYLKDEKNKIDIIDFINDADVGIKNILVEEENLENDELKQLLMKLEEKSKDLKKVEIINLKITSQRKKNNNSDIVDFDFEKDESEGTKKMLNFSGVIIDSIKNGKTIFLDEFDARLHPILTKAIVKLFNSEKNKSAQLCFVTHDTNLLDKDLLRRDQIYFAEKNQRGETSIYSLNEIKGVRNDSSLEKDYIKGKYGAIPFIRNLNSIFE